MTGRVLIGKVKNKHQLTVNLEERFYHIPEAVMVKSMLPVEYVALYFDEADTTGEKAVCIRYYGRVIKTELVLREEISSLPSSNNGRKYYKFTVDEWKKLPAAIVRDEGGVYAKAFVNIEALLAARKFSEIASVEEKSSRSKRRKILFTEEQIENVKLSEDLISANTLAELINSAGETKIIAAKITKYLLNNEYLKVKGIGGKNCRVATPKGEEIGIFSDRAQRNGREFYLTLYDKCAQQFVLDHINEIAKIRLNESYAND